MRGGGWRKDTSEQSFFKGDITFLHIFLFQFLKNFSGLLLNQRKNKVTTHTKHLEGKLNIRTL